MNEDGIWKHQRIYTIARLSVACMRMNQHVYRFRRRSIDLISVRTQSRLFTCLLLLFHCHYVLDSSTSYGSKCTINLQSVNLCNISYYFMNANDLIFIRTCFIDVSSILTASSVTLPHSARTHIYSTNSICYSSIGPEFRTINTIGIINYARAFHIVATFTA